MFIPSNCLKGMAGTTRLELATSAVTGQRSNQLNYVPNRGINDLRKTKQIRRLQGLHTVHSSLTAHAVAAAPTRTAHKNQCARARFIIAQIRGIGEGSIPNPTEPGARRIEAADSH
jgi:hypothetical protein